MPSENICQIFKMKKYLSDQDLSWQYSAQIGISHYKPNNLLPFLLPYISPIITSNISQNILNATSQTWYSVQACNRGSQNFCLRLLTDM